MPPGKFLCKPLFQKKRRPKRDAFDSLFGRASDQTRGLNCGPHEVFEQRVRIKGFRLQFGMELHADKPRMIFPLDNLWQATVR